MRKSPKELAIEVIDALPKSSDVIVVAIDGRSGSGKSTLAHAISGRISDTGGEPSVVIVEGDTFYAGGSAETWDRRSVDEQTSR